MSNVFFAFSILTFLTGGVPSGEQPPVSSSSFSSSEVALNQIAPATASSLPRLLPDGLPLNYEAGQITATAQINPVARRLLGRVLKQDVPSEVEFTATEMAGQVRLPQGKAELLDGTIALDATPLRTILAPTLKRAIARASKAYNFPPSLTPEQLEAMFQYRLSGQGVLTLVDESVNPTLLMRGNAGAAPTELESGPESAEPTPAEETRTDRFVFSYDDRTDRLTAEGIDPELWTACRRMLCAMAIDGDFEVDLDIEGVLDASEMLEFRLPRTVKRLLRNALFLGMDSLDFASGTVASDLRLHSVIPPKTAPRQTGVSPELVQRRGLNTVTQGNFVINAQRSTVPWSAVFSIP